MDEEYAPYKEKTATEKLWYLAKESPQLPIGMVALVAIVGHGLYNLRGRKQKLSLYLIHYRLAAQGTFLGCITLGLAYTIINEHFLKKIKKE